MSLLLSRYSLSLLLFFSIFLSCFPSVSSAPPPQRLIIGGGSHFSSLLTHLQAAFLQSPDWIDNFNGTLDYRTEPGEDGRSAFAEFRRPSDGSAANVTAIVTDRPLEATERSSFQSAGGQVLQIPTSLTGAIIVYNLPGFSSGSPLRLNASVVAGIFTGRIGRWSHQALAELNPVLGSDAQYDQPIQVCIRGSPSTTTYHLTQYLNEFSPADWSDGVSQTPAIFSPSATIKDDGNNLASFVGSNAFTIGYAKYRTARRSAALLTSLQNRSGRFVAPTDSSIAVAASSTSGNVPTPDQPMLNVFPGRSDYLNAYPGTSYMFIIVYSSLQAGSQAIRSFLLFLQSDSSQALSGRPTFFPSIPSAVRLMNTAAVQAMELPQSSSSTSNDDELKIGLGVGIGLGIPLLIIVVVLLVKLARGKNVQYDTKESVQLTNVA